MKKRIYSFFLAFIMMFTVFVPLMVSAEETTESTKTAFTVEELLQMGFVSSVDYSINDLQNIYNLSQNSSIEDFDSTIIASLGQPATSYYLYTSSNGGVVTEEIKSNTIAYGVVVMPKYYSIGGSDYTYYTNFSGSSSYYPFTFYSSRTVYSTSHDFSKASLMKNVVKNDNIIVFRVSNTTGVVERFIYTYAVYNYLGLQSPYDIFDTEYFKTVSATNYNSYDLDYYRLVKKDNSTSTDSDLPAEKNYQLWGVVLRSKEEIQAMKQSFIEWFIANNKIEYLISNGIDVSVEHISYLFDWWNAYGDNIVTITLNLPKLISNINIINWDINLAKRLVDCFENLYIQYQEYVAKLAYGETRPVQNNTNYMPHHRKDNTDDTLVTDTEEDTTVVILLREIVRLLIDLPESIRLSFVSFENRLNAIITNMNNIIMYLDSLPNYIANSISNNINFDVDYYIDNIDVLYVVTPENNPIVKFDDKITEKFPIINQSQQIVSIDNFISEENKTPIISMKNPALLFDSDDSNDFILASSESTENEIVLFDFSMFDDVIEIIKNILSFFIILGFGHWTINYIPKLLAGYNESD